jgi:hypothetical protein
MHEWLQIFFKWKHAKWYLGDKSIDYECKPKLLFKAKMINKETWRLYLYTDKYYYSITCSKKDDMPKYLWGWFGCRTPKAWEDWSRGWDLADGKYSKEVFDKIVSDILSLEIIELFN